MRVLICIAVLIAVAAAQIPRRCEAPARFEARVMEVDISKKFETRGRMSYDAVYRRTRTIEEVNIVDKREYYDVLRLHGDYPGQGVEYTLNLRTKACKKGPLTREWRPFEIPHNATFYGEAYVGSSSSFGDGVLVEIWGGDTPKGRYAGVWTVKDCIPIHDTFFSKQTGLVQVSFYDVVIGIEDPNVFIPPKECH